MAMQISTGKSRSGLPRAKLVIAAPSAMTFGHAIPGA
jgi:hypothetical protein